MIKNDSIKFYGKAIDWTEIKEEWRSMEKKNATGREETRVYSWGQREDGTWFAEFRVNGEKYMRLETAFRLKEIRERLAKHGIKNLPRNARVPMP